MARDKYLGVPEARHESEHQWRVRSRSHYSKYSWLESFHYCPLGL